MRIGSAGGSVLVGAARQSDDGGQCYPGDVADEEGTRGFCVGVSVSDYIEGQEER